ncbi:MAG: Coenzyme F420 hydrogenase/dehydrogenase, beta subunit C-terminal domain, partial [Candidatus Bathyarchaeia archaeon]
MKSKKRSLIAFDDLNLMIISEGFCTLCGACEAACPVHAIKIEENKLSYDDCSRFLDLCPICYDICPHTEPLLIEAMKFVAEAPMRREALGCYRKIMLAQAVEPKLREASHSGGVVTALLTHALENGIIDSAIISEAETQAPLKLKPLVGLVPDDVLSAVDSKFSPSAVAKAFGSAVRDYGKAKIAFVGVPHQILALRKLEVWEHKIMESLEMTIGLFCLWIFSLNQLLNYLANKFNIETSKIEKIDLTEMYNVYTTQGVLKIPISEVIPHVLNRCRTCMDFTSELADISVGGASPLKEWSTVIVRTKKGEEFFDDVVKSGAIETMEIETAHDVFTHLINLATHKRRIALREVKKMKRAKKLIPPAMDRLSMALPRETALLAGVKVKDEMAKHVVTVTPKITVSQLLDIITEHHHMGYPVVNERGELTGIVTFEDVAKVPKQKR